MRVAEQPAGLRAAGAVEGVGAADRGVLIWLRMQTAGAKTLRIPEQSRLNGDAAGWMLACDHSCASAMTCVPSFVHAWPRRHPVVPGTGAVALTSQRSGTWVKMMLATEDPARLVRRRRMKGVIAGCLGWHLNLDRRL